MLQNHGTFIRNHHQPQFLCMMGHGIQITGNDEQ
jgi:hypothetical protein